MQTRTWKRPLQRWLPANTSYDFTHDQITKPVADIDSCFQLVWPTWDSLSNSKILQKGRSAPLKPPNTPGVALAPIYTLPFLLKQIIGHFPYSKIKKVAQFH